MCRVEDMERKYRIIYNNNNNKIDNKKCFTPTIIILFLLEQRCDFVLRQICYAQFVYTYCVKKVATFCTHLNKLNSCSFSPRTLVLF